jgi:hypothetical protein
VLALIGGHGGGQGARDRRDGAVERQFPKDGKAVEGIRRNGPDGGHDAECDGKIVMAAFDLFLDRYS